MRYSVIVTNKDGVSAKMTMFDSEQEAQDAFVEESNKQHPIWLKKVHLCHYKDYMHTIVKTKNLH